MNVEHLKRWHWIVVGLFVGLLFGWLHDALAGDEAVAEGRGIGQETFERNLHVKERGYPKIRNVLVYPIRDTFVVEMQHFERDPTDKSQRRYLYRLTRLVTRTPFKPTVDRSETVETRIDLDKPHQVELVGWPSAGEGGVHDPATGSEIRLALKPANYELTVYLSGPQAQEPIESQLTASMNDHALDPFHRASDAARWQTTIPADTLLPGGAQVLKFSRKDKPVPLHEVSILNPTYTVRDYLEHARQSDPQFTYTYGWWRQPLAQCALAALAGVLLIGGVWPAVLNLLIGAGFGRPLPPEPEYDLDRFSHEQETQFTAAAGAIDPTALDAAIATMEAKLQPVGDAPATPPVPAPAAPIRNLETDPLDPLTQSDQPQQPKDYAGEFYPVVRKTGDKKTQ